MNPLMPGALWKQFGDQVQENIPLAPYTSARIGGPADYLMIARSTDELASAIRACWDTDQAYLLIGAGSNLLVGDKGLRGMAIINKAKTTQFRPGPEPTVWVESGALFSNLAHRCAAQGFAGLEWAATIPGTVGGAVYGNAGAFGGDTAHDLLRAEILTETGRAWWSAEEMQYAYRSSRLKRENSLASRNPRARALILSAEFRLKNSAADAIQNIIDQLTARRKASQPAGASMGSMFKNPAGDFAGRLIEAAGLKGTRIGSAEISTLHANFFINHSNQTQARDIRALIELAQKSVKEKFGVELELEVELVGEWE